MTYRHTQTGTLTLLCSVLVGVVGAALTWRAGQWAPAM